MNILSIKDFPNLGLKSVENAIWKENVLTSGAGEAERKEGMCQSCVVTLNFQDGTKREFEITVKGKTVDDVAKFQSLIQKRFEILQSNLNLDHFLGSLSGFSLISSTTTITTTHLASRSIKTNTAKINHSDQHQNKVCVTRMLTPFFKPNGKTIAILIKGPSLEENQKIKATLEEVAHQDGYNSYERFINACVKMNAKLGENGYVAMVDVSVGCEEFTDQLFSITFSIPQNGKINYYEILVRDSEVRDSIANYLNTVFAKYRDLADLQSFLLIQSEKNDDSVTIIGLPNRKKCTTIFHESLHPLIKPTISAKKPIRIFNGIPAEQRSKPTELPS